MPQLSILIPHSGEDEQLERTLLSVLENRPPNSEIIVCHDGGYSDPYQLAGEVDFVGGAPHATHTELVAMGVAKATGSITHLLRSGNEVTPGWVLAAVKHFVRPSVAAVAPVVVDVAHPDRLISAGIRLAAGKRTLNGAGISVHRVDVYRCEIVGPQSTAAFYRTNVLRQVLVGSSQTGDELIDLDWGLSIRALGHASRIAPASQILGSLEPRHGKQRNAYESGRCHERLFWRHAKGGPGSGGPWSGWAHLSCWLGNLHSPSAIAGRIAGFQERKRIEASYRRWLEQYGLPSESTKQAAKSLGTAAKQAA